jgi:hypothetical protein
MHADSGVVALAAMATVYEDEIGKMETLLAEWRTLLAALKQSSSALHDWDREQNGRELKRRSVSWNEFLPISMPITAIAVLGV